MTPTRAAARWCKADSIAGQVSIQVDGPEQTRRELLAIIRYNFQVIHADSKLKPDELVYPPGVPERPQRLGDLEAFFRSDASSKILIKLPNETVITPTAASLMEPVKTNVEPLRLFLSYSHKDKKYVDELRKALKPTERNGLIQPWYDGEITAGEEWKPLIDQRLEDADIIVCQLSRDFLDSDFCVLNELETAIQRREAGEAGLVAYVLHDCDWKATKVAKFQIFPSEAKAIDGRSNKHKYWTEIADGIKTSSKSYASNGQCDQREKCGVGWGQIDKCDVRSCPRNVVSGTEHWSNSLRRRGAIKILGVLRRLLSRVAPSELLRMTQGKKYGWKQAEGRRFFCCGETIDACAAPPGLDSLFYAYPGLPHRG